MTAIRCQTLQKISNVNLRSLEQWDKVIYLLFAQNKAAIDLYLLQVVFPKEAKEFPHKLFGSSLDLAEKQEKPITSERAHSALLLFGC